MPRSRRGHAIDRTHEPYLTDVRAAERRIGDGSGPTRRSPITALVGMYQQKPEHARRDTRQKKLANGRGGTAKDQGVSSESGVATDLLAIRAATNGSNVHSARR